MVQALFIVSLPVLLELPRWAIPAACLVVIPDFWFMRRLLRMGHLEQEQEASDEEAEQEPEDS